jgi:cobalt-precorrin 5A hydrolase
MATGTSDRTMGGTKTMIAIGIGCRSGARKEAIIALVTEARTRIAADEMPSLFTYEGKRNEDGLTAAAQALSLPLTYLSHEALQAVADKIMTHSEAAEKALGLPSVAEAAALAGCGVGAQLRVPRMTSDGVTCAIAVSEGGGQ